MKRRNPRVIDAEATALAGFTDHRSYIKRNKDGDSQTFLFGDDLTQLRRRAFDRSRGFCEMPLRGFTGQRCNRNISWETGELHHRPSLSQGGDDSLEGVLFICRRCHVATHGRITRFGEKHGEQ